MKVDDVLFLNERILFSEDPDGIRFNVELILCLEGIGNELMSNQSFLEETS